MNILLITDLYPVKEDEKTTPKTLSNFVREWENSGHKVDVIKPNFILNSFIRKKPFYKTGLYGKILNLNYWLPFCFNVKQKYNFSLDYDLAIAHMPSGILFADKLNIPFVAGIHNSDLTVLSNPFYKFYFGKRLKKALDNSKAIACRSYVIKEKLLKLCPQYAHKTFVAPSGINKSIINDNIYENEIDKHNLKIVTCANIIKRKHIDKLIRACRRTPNVELTVIGDGKLRKKLEKIDRNVKFTGHLKPTDVYKIMRQNDIFILPSVNETFGMVYLEAMASGCITVCTKNDGIDGIIKDGENGFLVEPNVEDIYKLISEIKNSDTNKLMRLKKNSINTIKNLTSDVAAQNYINQILRFCND